MKNAFKLGAVALFLSASMVACKGSGSAATLTGVTLTAATSGSAMIGSIAVLPNDGCRLGICVR